VPGVCGARATPTAAVVIEEVESDPDLLRNLPVAPRSSRLEPGGDCWTTAEFIKFIEHRMVQGTRAVVFLIGGAEGLTPTMVKAAQKAPVALASHPAPSAWPAWILCEQNLPGSLSPAWRGRTTSDDGSGCRLTANATWTISKRAFRHGSGRVEFVGSTKAVNLGVAARSRRGSLSSLRLDQLTDENKLEAELNAATGRAAAAQAKATPRARPPASSGSRPRAARPSSGPCRAKPSPEDDMRRAYAALEVPVGSNFRNRAQVVSCAHAQSTTPTIIPNRPRSRRPPLSSRRKLTEAYKLLERRLRR